MLSAGADANACTNAGITPLYKAAILGHRGIVDLLICGGARVDTPSEGNTPLFMAIHNGFPEVVASLLAAGADRTLANSGHETPLFVAALTARREIITQLLRPN